MYTLVDFGDAGTTCSSDYSIELIENKDLEGCEDSCDANPDCMYFLLSGEDEGSYCELFSDCSDVEALVMAGSTYEREYTRNKPNSSTLNFIVRPTLFFNLKPVNFVHRGCVQESSLKSGGSNLTLTVNSNFISYSNLRMKSFQ